jgi:hypothetical protein
MTDVTYRWSESVVRNECQRGKSRSRRERQLDGLGNKLLVREYLTPLSLESELAREINRARAVLMRQAEARRLARAE